MNEQASSLPLPPELVTRIFQALPCFLDVFNFASTARRFRIIWCENAPSIYERVVRRSIPCHRHARRLLADQGGPPVDSATLSMPEILKLAHNAALVDKAISRFERDVVRYVRFPYPAEQFYGPTSNHHPPTLTQTERPRFIRSYYQLWSLKKLCAAEQESRLKAMILKRLYQLFEMSMLDQNIGCEEEEDITLRWEQRLTLQFKVNGQMDRISGHLRRCPAPRVDHYGATEGSSTFVSMWDHWQPSLFEVVCCRKPTWRCLDSELERLVLWDNSSDEDT
ncbi:hypothetical protein EV356DRAFT_514839 [Viridothelium virens]|uniref:F-box domain-containing protein n=1 Tax=Viridothelium virens TaxID=1048519 RepID=A0A6A6HA15_VIRVR|nr:hypothetical protein EV356DRAFT_514839 [Viridothelium virens]